MRTECMQGKLLRLRMAGTVLVSPAAIGEPRKARINTDFFLRFAQNLVATKSHENARKNSEPHLVSICVFSWQNLSPKAISIRGNPCYPCPPLRAAKIII